VTEQHRRADRDAAARVNGSGDRRHRVVLESAGGQRHLRAEGDRGQQRPINAGPPVRHFGCWRTERFPVQRATYPVGQLAEAFGAKGFGNGTSHSVEARMPPPPEYAVVAPKRSLASTTMTDSPSRSAAYAPTSPPRIR
jgi:hypothetical protein